MNTLTLDEELWLISDCAAMRRLNGTSREIVPIQVKRWVKYQSDSRAELTTEQANMIIKELKLNNRL